MKKKKKKENRKTTTIATPTKLMRNKIHFCVRQPHERERAELARLHIIWQNAHTRNTVNSFQFKFRPPNRTGTANMEKNGEKATGPIPILFI